MFRLKRVFKIRKKTIVFACFFILSISLPLSLYAVTSEKTFDDRGMASGKTCNILYFNAYREYSHGSYACVYMPYLYLIRCNNGKAEIIEYCGNVRGMKCLHDSSDQGYCATGVGGTTCVYDNKHYKLNETICSNSKKWITCDRNGKWKEGGACNESKTSSVNGKCGSANGQTSSVIPTSNLCSAGTSSTVSLSGTTYRWTCKGTGTGTSANCSASKQTIATVVNGKCGSANGQTFSNAPTSSLCSAGTASTVSLSGTTYRWTCKGTESGQTVNCSASKASIATSTDGICGAWCVKQVGQGATPYCKCGDSKAESGFELVGSSSKTSDCAARICYAFREKEVQTEQPEKPKQSEQSTPSNSTIAVTKINGICGTRNTVYAANFTTWPSGSTWCSSGTVGSYSPNNVFPREGEGITWVCSGAGGGSNASCSASREISETVLTSCNSNVDCSRVAPFEICHPVRNVCLRGDVLNNGVVALNDFIQFKADYVSYNLYGWNEDLKRSDFNEDQKITMSDYGVFVRSYRIFKGLDSL
jgi:hypothetical protein